MNKGRTLLIDAQLFQSYTFHRGMGKYSLALLESLNNALPAYTNKVLLFNNISGYLSDEEMAVIKKATPGFSYEFLSFKHIDDPAEYTVTERHNRRVVDDYMANRLPDQDIDFLILSLFQETELPVFPTTCRNRFVLVYDLIPLQFFDPYLKVESVAQNYLNRFATLFEADHFFTISKSVASDVALLLGVPKDRITPIYGAPVKRAHLEKIAVPFLENKKFILLPSGDDFRKNNLVAAKAFAMVNSNADITLVVTSSFTDVSKALLESVSPDIYFSGNVSEQQLAWLYEHAELIFFPSQAEGLGLPILEAVEFKKKVVCSNIMAFKEIDEKTLYFCDPYIQDDVSRVLESALHDGPLPESAYQGILDRYTWDVSAHLAGTVLSKKAPEPRVSKKKVAVFSPKPDGFSGIGKVVQEQHYGLSRIAHVTYFFDNGVSERAKTTEIRKNYLKYSADTKDPWTFNEASFREYDSITYHIGNGEYHVTSLIKALTFPSQVVLHDTRIKGLYNVARSIGLISTERYEAEQTVNDTLSPKSGEFLTSLVSRQNRVIVHSQYSKSAVEEAFVSVDGAKPSVLKINLAIAEPFDVEKQPEKATSYVAIAGLMTESKGVELAQSLTKIKVGDSKVRVKIFGFSMLDSAALSLLRANKSIELIQSPTDTRYLYELSQSDIMLNFRHPYHGETSYSTLEGIRFGKSTIVNNTGWFAEIPDDIVYKINSIDDVHGTIKRIIQKGTDARTMTKRTDYIVAHHNIQDYVQKLIG